MDDWMKNQGSTNVADIVKTQDTQYALEKAASTLSDPAFQSFLTNAPIPRISNGGPPIGVYATGTTNVVWTTSSYFDPYNMATRATGFMTIPLDGFWILNFSLLMQGTVNSFMRTYWDIAGGSALGVQTTPDVVAAGVYEGGSTVVYPMRAGTIIKPTVINSGAATYTILGGNLGCSWIAPYTNYQGGQ